MSVSTDSAENSWPDPATPRRGRGRFVLGILAGVALLGLLAWIRMALSRSTEEGATFTVTALTSAKKDEVCIDWTANVDQARGTLVVGWIQSGKETQVATVRQAGGLMNALWDGSQSGVTGSSWFGVSPGVFESEVQKGTVIHLRPGERRTLGHWTGDKTESQVFVSLSNEP